MINVWIELQYTTVRSDRPFELILAQDSFGVCCIRVFCKFLVDPYYEPLPCRGGWLCTWELIHNIMKQLFSLKFLSNHNYLKFDLKFNRYAVSTTFNLGTHSK